MSLMSFLALALLVALVFIVAFLGLWVVLMHRGIIDATTELQPAPKKIRTPLRRSLWWSVDLARLRQAAVAVGRARGSRPRNADLGHEVLQKMAITMSSAN